MVVHFRIHTGGMYLIVHPRGPRDFPQPLKMSLGPRPQDISRASGNLLVLRDVQPNTSWLDTPRIQYHPCCQWIPRNTSQVVSEVRTTLTKLTQPNSTAEPHLEKMSPKARASLSSIANVNMFRFSWFLSNIMINHIFSSASDVWRDQKYLSLSGVLTVLVEKYFTHLTSLCLYVWLFIETQLRANLQW